MRHFTIRFDSAERLEEATSKLGGTAEREDGQVVRDPAGNAALLTT
jgi:hypothetical protein